MWVKSCHFICLSLEQLKKHFKFINTSMNVMGEPIVNTPEQAHAMILKTDMDYIIMGNYVLGKE